MPTTANELAISSTVLMGLWSVRVEHWAKFMASACGDWLSQFSLLTLTSSKTFYAETPMKNVQFL